MMTDSAVTFVSERHSQVSRWGKGCHSI